MSRISFLSSFFFFFFFQMGTTSAYLDADGKDPEEGKGNNC